LLFVFLSSGHVGPSSAVATSICFSPLLFSLSASTAAAATTAGQQQPAAVATDDGTNVATKPLGHHP